MPNPSPSPKPVYILGISCHYHDSACALLKDGEILFAAQEERYTRKKHDPSFPKNAIAQALRFAGIDATDLAAVCFYEKPFLKFFDRILTTFFRTWPRGYFQYLKAMQAWMTEKLWTSQRIGKELGYRGDVFYAQHHESHAASAYCCSGFPDATIVTVDGVGEWATATIGYGKGATITLRKEIHYPHSLGLLYSALTYYLGFKVNSAEYKVMGLAPYGEPTHMEEMHKLITLKEDGSFRLNMGYFTYEYGLRMTGRAMERLFGQPRRKPEESLTQFHKDVARSLQEITNEVMLAIVRHAKEVCPSDHLCLAGGVALNCVTNGKILRSGLFKDIFIQPAAGDAGGALGAALAIWNRKYQLFSAETPYFVETPYMASLRPAGRASRQHTTNKRMDNVFLGNEYTDEEIESAINAVGALHATPLPYARLDDQSLTATVARLLANDNVIGWFQGRMEFGPRALGNRSILADARNKENRQRVNLKIKFRESFRPFAPTVLQERVSDYFELDRPSPFMLLVADVRKDRRAEIPAVTHVDGSARIQTIRRDQNPRYYDLLKEFERRTGCPVIINTSFNIRGEPIVESPEDALNCFLATHMDCLAMGNFLLRKKKIPKQSLQISEKHLGRFESD